MWDQFCGANVYETKYNNHTTKKRRLRLLFVNEAVYTSYYNNKYHTQIELVQESKCATMSSVVLQQLSAYYRSHRVDRFSRTHTTGMPAFCRRKKH